MWLPFLIVSPAFFGHLSSWSWITQNSADIRRRTVSWREACCLVFFLLCYNWHWPINVLQLPSDYVVARVRSVACGKKKNISCLKTWLATLKKISTPRKNCNGNHQAKPNWKWSKQGEIDQIVFPKSWVATYSKVTKCWLQNVQSVGYLCLFRPSFFY